MKFTTVFSVFFLRNAAPQSTMEKKTRNVSVKERKNSGGGGMAAGEPDQTPRPRLWARIGRFIFNPDHGTVLTRTPLSWLQILLLTLTYWFIVVVSALVCWAIFQVHMYR